ncbi:MULTISPECIES: DUF5919 domain-containing protein [Micromonospora]|uniref:Helix-turn-helix domain-containing protein n=1 Tax=Micromonospora chalcea TaxID=1874 RepID=A0ABX9Y847_MICCH|nr:MULTISPECIES: DUF5919 domain-containing protein [Micromonospora]EWM68470.1 transcriptional regulator, XRE family [Micromonospora sp. M42]MBF5031261.1 helix-turn-helix domain-containing protein [Micromonospora sp. ANENR4]MBQ1064650.1 helix-turn-helix domain-containing protein [Micromonospora sp. C41]MBQ1066349.1 helix-turn-helix domain-containing protein [Micromonospora sp. D75]MCK1807951.1 DUF5919 domain-containing protein [Micromonospora sp. R42106]
MTTVQKWTGRETRMLRHALRMSIRDFAEHLGVSERTVSKWEAGREAVQPRPEIQAALDTALARAGNEVHRRFRSGLGLADAAELRQGAADIQAEGNGGTSIADVTAVFRNRAELSAHLPADRILDGARKVRAMGLSLNLLCQHYPDHRWRQLIEGGAQVRCLFLDPDGSAIQAREREESFPAGQLAALTKLNIETMLRVRDRLSGDLYGNVQLALYDETLRFNVLLIDDLCLAQAYLPASRGVDSPTFVMRRREPTTGLYPVYEQIFDSQWERSRQL